MGHGTPGEPGADAFIAQADRWERLLAEERERTVVMTLANDDKRQELRSLLILKDDLLEALVTAEALIVEELEPSDSVASSPGVDAIRETLSQVRAAIDKGQG